MSASLSPPPHLSPSPRHPTLVARVHLPYFSEQYFTVFSVETLHICVNFLGCYVSYAILNGLCFLFFPSSPHPTPLLFFCNCLFRFSIFLRIILYYFIFSLKTNFFIKVFKCICVVLSNISSYLFLFSLYPRYFPMS